MWQSEDKLELQSMSSIRYLISLLRLHSGGLWHFLLASPLKSFSLFKNRYKRPWYWLLLFTNYISDACDHLYTRRFGYYFHLWPPCNSLHCHFCSFPTQVLELCVILYRFWSFYAISVASSCKVICVYSMYEEETYIIFFTSAWSLIISVLNHGWSLSAYDSFDVPCNKFR